MVAQPLTRNEPTIRELLERTDCRDVARALQGDPVKEFGKFNRYFNKSGERTASLDIYADGFKNRGTGGEGGKTLAYIEYALDCDRERAKQWLKDWHNLPSTAQIQRRPAPVQKKIVDLVPDKDWQRSAGKLVDTCESALWSPAGASALDYLRNRGLLDSTIQSWQLGYNIKENCITIPEYEGDTLVRVHRRFLAPNAESRYRAITGSKVTLYGGDLIDPARPVVFVFGEFDALIGNQIAGDIAVFVTTGSDSNRVPKHWAAQLRGLDTFILCHDNDESGQAVASPEGRSRMGIPAPHVTTSVPSGKDLTDFVTSGGDLRTWVTEQIEAAQVARILILISNPDPEPRAVWNASMLPGYVHYLLNSDVPDRALVLLALAAVDGLNRPVELSEIADRDLMFGETTIHVQRKTLSNIVKRDGGIVFELWKDLYTIENTNPQVYKSFHNSQKRGRRSPVIALKAPDAFTLVLAPEVHASLARRYFPQGKKASLFPALTVEHVLDTNGAPSPLIPQAHEQITGNQNVQRVYAEQDQPKADKRKQYAERSFKRLRQQLTARRLLTLPAWTIGTVAELRSALYLSLTARAVAKNKTGKSQLSAAYYAMMLGTTRTTAINIAGRLADCVIQQKAELKAVKITNAAQLDADLGGLPIVYEVFDPVKGTTENVSAFWSGSRSKVSAAIRGRHEVTVKVQPANEQQIKSWEQPEKQPRKRKPAAPVEVAPVQGEITSDDPIEQKPERAEVWPKFDNPRRAYAWQLILNLLDRAEGIRLVGRSLYDRRGNLLKHEPTGRDLLVYLGAECLGTEQIERAA